MGTLAALAFTYLPQIINGIKLLGKIPDAVNTVKDLTVYAQKTIVNLKREKLTPEQKNQLDDLIESMKDEPHWQPEEK